MANMSESLAIHGKGNDWLKEINESQHHLHALAERGVRLGMRFVMKAAEWEALKLITDLHEVQLENSTVYDIEKAYDYVEKTIREGKAKLIRTKEQPNETQENKS
jgi:DNA-binding ferritin-like protein